MWPVILLMSRLPGGHSKSRITYPIPGSLTHLQNVNINNVKCKRQRTFALSGYI